MGYVRDTGQISGVGVTSSNGSFGALPAAGNMVAVLVSCYDVSGTVADGNVTDNQGNTYSLDLGRLSTNTSVSIHSDQSIGAPSGTFTITIDPPGAIAYIEAVGVEYSGVAAPTALDSASSAVGSDLSPTVTTAATTQTDALVLGLGAVSDPSTTSIGIDFPAGYSQRGNIVQDPSTTVAFWAGDKIVSAIGAQSFDGGTLSRLATLGWVIECVTYKLTGAEAPAFQSNAFQNDAFQTLASDVTLALTGVASSAGVGTLSVQMTFALSGVAATGAAGIIGTGVGLTGVPATGAAGLPAVVFTITPTGVAGTAAVGTPAVAFTSSLSGVVGTGAVGSEGVGSGVSAAVGTGAVGTPAVAFTNELTGVAAAGAVGTPAVEFTNQLIGVSATGVAGAASTPGDVIVGLSGVSATGALGSTVVSFDVGTSGATSGVGAAGTLSGSLTKALTGVVAAGSVGSESVGVAGSATDAVGTGAVGTPAVSFTKALSGVAAAGNAGDVTVFSADRTLELVGAAGQGRVGAVGAPSSQVDVLVGPMHGPGRLPPKPEVLEVHGVLRISGGGKVVIVGHKESEQATPDEQVFAFLLMAA